MSRSPVQEHAYDPTTDICLHCHVPKSNVEKSQTEAKLITCIWRWEDAITTERTRKISAADDFDMIGARLEQLRKEQAAIRATVQPV
jgi:hypothetical protein